MKEIIGKKILAVEIDKKGLTMTLKDDSGKVILFTINHTVKISADIIGSTN